MIRIGTIQEHIDNGYTIRVYCHRSACNHHAILDLHKLRDRFGPDFRPDHDTLVPKLKCSKCGGKKVGLILSPPSKTNNFNPYVR